MGPPGGGAIAANGIPDKTSVDIGGKSVVWIAVVTF
jgi:hypothetical protein